MPSVNKNPKPTPRVSAAAAAAQVHAESLAEVTGRLDGLAEQLTFMEARADKRAANLIAAAPKPADPQVVAARVEGSRAKVRYVVTGAVIAFVAVLLFVAWLLFLHSPLGS